MIDEVEAPVEGQAVSAGKLLKRAREASGMHVAAVAVSLKVPVRKLEALEDDRYEELGDPVFVRALASSVCRTIKCDPQPILERLPQTSAPRLVRDTDGLNAPFRAPGDGAPPTWIDTVRQPVPLAVLALLVGAVVIYFLPATHTDDKVAVAPAAPVAAVPTPAVQPAPAPMAAASEPVAAAPAPAPAAVVTQAAAPAPAPEPSQAATAAAPAPASGIVVVRTKGESWVEVVDAKGVAVLRKIMAGGESAGASGALPLTVTIGKVDQTEVEVRGKKFDMRPVSKDNVARFEVK